ncbi:ABC transporter substrate-binding protein [Chloroflexota bacterium]
MKRSVVWLIMSCFMVAALVLSSCTSTVTEEEEVVVTEEEAVLEGAALQEAVLAGKVEEVEKPRYGGEINLATNFNQTGFDDALAGQTTFSSGMFTTHLSNEELLVGDWTKGPAGTGDTLYWTMYLLNPKYWVGSLAETWEIVDGDTLVYNIREGVHFHDPALKPDNEAMALVNGREFVADDVIFHLERLWANPGTYLYNAAPRNTDIVRLEAPDKYTVIIETTGPDRLPYPWQLTGGWTNMYPRDAIEEYGDLTDWKHSVGTGPFYLEDYVDGSGATMKRNPDWWRKNPIGPGKGDQLPYLDGVNYFFILDPSQRLAAMRTGKVDFLREVLWEEADSLLATNPELLQVGYVAESAGISFRMDNPEFVGYNDERGLQVRRALSLAIDQQAIADEYYGGHAAILSGPVGLEGQFASARTELKDLPLSADGFDNSKLFGYYPDEAESILDEAGYTGPERMKLTLPVSSDAEIDLFSLVKAYWADIGVDLELDVMELAAMTALGSRKGHTDLWPIGWMGTYPFAMVRVRYGDAGNFCMLNDSLVNDAYYQMMDAYFDWDERLPIMHDISLYLLDLNPIIQLPASKRFNFWQPWVKNFHGEFSVGNYNLYNFVSWAWLDEDMKEEMTGN